jgi:hypothetical protein
MLPISVVYSWCYIFMIQWIIPKACIISCNNSDVIQNENYQMIQLEQSSDYGILFFRKDESQFNDDAENKLKVSSSC